MNRTGLMQTRSKLGWLSAMTMAASLLLAAPAWAASGQGSADLRLAQHSKGRTLSGQGVKVIAGSPAQRAGKILTLPISSVETGPAVAATSEGWLRFKRGKRGAVLSGLRFDLTAGTLNGSLGGEEITVFRLGAPTQVDAAAGRVSLVGGKLRLTAEAATALRDQLGLERALARKGVGMVWLAAQATRKPATPLGPSRVAVPVVSGEAGWGVLASWRKYVLGNFPPGSAGTITTADGATEHGTLAEPDGYFGFPDAAGSSFEKGLDGASDRLVLRTQGSVTFAKPMHCIVEVKLADIVVTLDGADSSLALDSVYDIDKPESGSCGPVPPVSTSDVDFATLDLTGIAPAYSADGKTVTWSAIPATLTAAGSEAFGLGTQYEEGQALDPVTVTVGLG